MTIIDRKSADTPRDPDLAGAEIAMRRAAKRARRLARETTHAEIDRPLGPDGQLGGLTQREIGQLRHRLQHLAQQDEETVTDKGQRGSNK